MGRRGALYAVVALTCAFLMSACVSPSAPSTTSPTPSNRTLTSSKPPQAWSVVALGDSVPRGTNCRCSPYPELTAASLTVSAARDVTATNDAVGGFTSADVLKQLRTDPEVISQVTNADIVEIEVGANDVAFGRSCGTADACYQPTIRSTEHNLTEIVARVRELTEGHPVLVILLDYWSVWLGGHYAAAEGPEYVDAAMTVTDQVNDVIKSTAADTGSAYVDLRAAFKGPNYAADETRYLASDGDHPNAAGQQEIATAVVGVATQTLHLPDNR